MCRVLSMDMGLLVVLVTVPPGEAYSPEHYRMGVMKEQLEMFFPPSAINMQILPK